VIIADPPSLGKGGQIAETTASKVSAQIASRIIHPDAAKSEISDGRDVIFFDFSEK